MSHAASPFTFVPDLDDVRAALTTAPGYLPTPLHRVTIDGRPLIIKDERDRFGLGSFKPLGGIYAVARLAEPGSRIVCASAGNHGTGIAAGAARIGAYARIYLPEGTHPAFADRIARLGGEVRWSSGDYDAACAEARAYATTAGAIWLPDGDAAPDAAAPPVVMAGYQLLAEEIREDCERTGDWPAHVFVQAGVGGLAAAVAHHIRSQWRMQPRITVVEAATTPCLAASAAAGRTVTVSGTPTTMRRLDCPVPSYAAWAILAALDVDYAAVTDEQATAAVTDLSVHGFDTTPSGAAGYAACRAIANTEPALVIVTEAALPATTKGKTA